MAEGLTESCGEKISVILVISTLSLFFLPSVVPLSKCNTIDSCRASTDEGIIDLKPLARTGNQSRFSKIPEADKSKNKNTYSWNPCIPWSQKSPNSTKNTCQDVAVCLAIQETLFYDVGKANTARFQLDSTTGHCSLTYNGSMFNQLQTKVQIDLDCNKDEEGKVDEFSASHSDKISIFKTTLHSKYACPPTSGLSTGSVLLIIFFTVLVVYLFGGMLFLKFSRGASGKELVPNYSFWANIISLIEEGCVFTVVKLKGLCSRGGVGYQSI